MPNWDLARPWLSLDQWQKDYINEDGDCFVLCGRQSGKTAAASIKFGSRAALNPKQTIMMIALTEKQAYALFFKTLMYLQAEHPKLIKMGKDKPTKHEINLKNGSKIMCYAAGLTGDGLRTFTLTSLVVDEASTMAKEIFIACLPMLSVTGGTLDIISTPKGEQGFFFDCSKDPKFRKFYVNAEDCPRHDKEHIEEAKKRMSTMEYAQEYLAKFQSEFKKVFSPEWIKKNCTGKRPERVEEGEYYLGVDIARLGMDKCVHAVFKREGEKITQVDNIVLGKQLTTETEEKIIALDKKYNFEKIYLDMGSGSLGVGIGDMLLRHDQTMYKVVAIDNKARALDVEDKSKTKLLKEDLYNNLVALGEHDRLQLLDDDEIIEELLSVQFEYVVKSGQRTGVRYTHTDIVEALTRGAYCSKEDIINMQVYSIKI